MRWILGIVLLGLCLAGCERPAVDLPVEPATVAPAGPPPEMPTLTSESAVLFADLALHCIDTEYPNKTGQVLAGPDEVLSPSALHPAFHGCFDWHSAVHGHWALVRQLKQVEGHPRAAAMRAALEPHFAPELLAAELAYFEQPHHKSFERPYGWAWYLRLAAETRTWEDADAQRWASAMRPLEELIVERLIAFLPLQNYPVRVGTHTNTAYALTHALDYARAVEHTQLEQVVVQRAREYYLADVDCPANYEPSGTDFLSPCLEEADLMRRVLPQDEFVPWLEGFFPDPAGADFASLREPAVVLDLSDGYLIHLVGLNLSRSWCLVGVADALPADHPHRAVYQNSAARHAEAGLALVSTGEYGGEHWLATYAVYLLTDAGR